MIYTVTFNPSLDYVVSVDNFRRGRTNRTASEQLFPGGKGINVSLVLQALGLESTALGFVAGFSGEEIVRRLAERNVKGDFIRLSDGFSRINVKWKDGTEINGRGPDIPAEELGRMLERLEQLSDGDILFLSGSIPPSIPDDIYQRILDRLAGRDVTVAVDATGELLLKTLPYRPFLIKPNRDELKEIFALEELDYKTIVSCARELQQRGARNVLVSLAEDGALLVTEDGDCLDMAAPEGELVNAVGSGDAMVAGFMAGWLQRGDYRYAFCLGLAAGTASAFSEHFAGGDEIWSMHRAIMSAKNQDGLTEK